MKKVFFLILLLAICLSLSAQHWLPLKQEAQKQEAWINNDAVVLLDSIGVKVNDNGSGSFTIHQVVLIQNKTGGLKHRVIKYDYDPLTAFAEFTDVTIYKSDGTIRTVPLSTTCNYTAPARAIYWGARQIMIEIGTLDAGDVIDYSIHKKGFTYALLAADDEERFVPPMRGHFYDIVPFWVKYPTVTKAYTVDVPRSKEIQYEFYQGTCQSYVRMKDDRKILGFSMFNINPFEYEQNMLDLFDVAPKLMLSSTPEWKDKSLWFYNVNENYGSFNAYPEAQKKVDEIIKGKSDEMEIIAALTHWVADNMRYSGISMGEGEGFTLHNTQMNFTDRCGVCKDKAALLISFLRMAGFEAYPAMTMAGSRVETIPADHFNHSVVVVKLSNGQYMPLDPTWVPFLRELWSSAEQQQNYLPGIPEGSDLLITPVSPPENHYFKLNANTALNEKGTLTGTFTVIAEGQSDGSVRRTFTRGFMENWQNDLEMELLQAAPQAKLISVNYGENPKDYIAAPISITMTFEIPNYALATDGVLFCKPISGGLYSNIKSYLRVNTDKESRKHGFRDGCSRYVELLETMTVPKGYTLKQELPATTIENSDVAEFSGSLVQNDNQIIINHRLILKKRIYESTDWSDFRTAVSAHKNLANEMLILEK